MQGPGELPYPEVKKAAFPRMVGEQGGSTLHADGGFSRFTTWKVG